MLTTAVSDMETAFVDAAGRSLPNATELGAGDVSGLTFPPGLYKWSSGVYADNTGFTISGGTNDVWIFQIAQSLLLASSSIVTLAGGAQAKNIFWQVEGAVTLGTWSAFHGNILCATGVVLQTGSILNGRVLAQAAATADGESVTIPSEDSNSTGVECCVNGSTVCNPTNGICYIECNVTVENCLWCSTLFVCETCIDGWYLNDYTCIQNGECDVTVENCMWCSTLFFCETCIGGWYLNNSTCIQNGTCDVTVENCMWCSTLLDCETCNGGWYLNDYTCIQNGTCDVTVENCLWCSTLLDCETCNGGWYLNNSTCIQNGTCDVTVENCLWCSTLLDCETCNGGWYLNNSTCIQNGTCDVTVENCLWCSTLFVCETCIDGWYLNDYTCIQNGTCDVTVENCMWCSTLFVCETCNGGWYLNNSTCIQNGTCDVTVENCLWCSTLFVCETCIDGWYLNDYTCIQNGTCDVTVENCMWCSTLFVCETCNGGWYLNNSTCIQNGTCDVTVENCLWCSTLLVCETCIGGWHLNEYTCIQNGECDVCPEGTVCCSVTAERKGPSPVNLGTSENFAVLTKAGVSRTGLSFITGDVGVSPIASTAMTGFALILDSSTQFSTSSFVNGRLYGADYSVPTPSMLTTAVSDMETAFVDAAGRSLPNATELGAGDVSGLTFPPGLYKWSSGVYADNTGFTISGGTNDVWIFQIAQSLLLASSSIVTLSGGAQAKNIFWQVEGAVTLGTTSFFHGNILCATAVVLQTGSILNGRVLAQTAATTDGESVTIPTSENSTVECCVNGSTVCNPTNGICSIECNVTVENCLWCSTLFVCETCIDGWYIDDSTGQCEDCPYGRCQCSEEFYGIDCDSCDVVHPASGTCTQGNCAPGYVEAYCDSISCSPTCHFDATCSGPNTCVCNVGYSGEGYTCDPVCSPNCHADATCIASNTGSNTCVCDIGYSGDGYVCSLRSTVLGPSNSRKVGIALAVICSLLFLAFLVLLAIIGIVVIVVYAIKRKNNKAATEPHSPKEEELVEREPAAKQEKLDKKVVV